jgi:hypothetical protein
LVFPAAKVQQFSETTKKPRYTRISELNGIFDSRDQKEVLFTNNTAFEIVDRYIDSNGVIRIKLIEK